MSNTAGQKYEQLKSLLQSYERVIVALSGGLDSSFLLYAAVDSIGAANTTAAIGVSPALAQADLEFAKKFATDVGLPSANILLIPTEEIDDENYSSNPSNRCFFCKSELYEKLNALASERTNEIICDGANASDIGDYRPGMQAAREKKIKSPLLEVNLDKNEIRELAKQFGLSVWDKPQSPCLASRIPYGSPVTVEKLRQIEAAEAFLRNLGFREFRVRHHDQVARIELPVADMSRLINNGVREQIVAKFRELGFLFTALDIGGFQSGNLNTMLKGAKNV